MKSSKNSQDSIWFLREAVAVKRISQKGSDETDGLADAKVVANAHDRSAGHSEIPASKRR